MPLTQVPDSVASALKKETYVNHRLAEALLGPKLEDIQSLKDYEALLRMYYGFYAPLEEKLISFIPFSVLPDIGGRKKAAWLERDLQALGLNPHQVDLCQDLPEITSIPAALGALYVLEGSTLGGRMIRKMLLRKYGNLLPEDGLHFFTGYDEETGPQWTRFLEVLNRYGAETPAIIASADASFSKLAGWIRKSLCHEREN